MTEPRWKTWFDRLADSLPIWLCVLLLTVGTVNGGAYSGFVAYGAIAPALYWYWSRRWLPSPDPWFAALAALFALWCWLSLAWSIDQGATLTGAEEITAILLVAVLFLASPQPPDSVVPAMFNAGALAVAAGALIVLVDGVFGFALQAAITQRPGHFAVVKYHRGLDHLLLLVPPLLAWQVRAGRQRLATLVALIAAAAVVWAGGAAGRSAAAAAVLALLAARQFPTLYPRLLGWLVTLTALTLPVLVHEGTDERHIVVAWIKRSGVDRLEIWNYMSARALEQPWLGWGAAAAKYVPIRPEELAHYAVAGHGNTYPHNQWLELWVETGLPGALLGLAFALLVLARIRGLPRDIRPFAHASFAAALVLSWLNFEVFTDAWWCALAASGWLFAILVRGPAPTRGAA